MPLKVAVFSRQLVAALDGRLYDGFLPLELSVRLEDLVQCALAFELCDDLPREVIPQLVLLQL